MRPPPCRKRRRCRVEVADRADDFKGRSKSQAARHCIEGERVKNSADLVPDHRAAPGGGPTPARLPALPAGALRASAHAMAVCGHAIDETWMTARPYAAALERLRQIGRAHV